MHDVHAHTRDGDADGGGVHSSTAPPVRRTDWTGVVVVTLTISHITGCACVCVSVCQSACLRSRAFGAFWVEETCDAVSVTHAHTRRSSTVRVCERMNVWGKRHTRDNCKLRAAQRSLALSSCDRSFRAGNSARVYLRMHCIARCKYTHSQTHTLIYVLGSGAIVLGPSCSAGWRASALCSACDSLPVYSHGGICAGRVCVCVCWWPKYALTRARARRVAPPHDHRKTRARATPPPPPSSSPRVLARLQRWRPSQSHARNRSDMQRNAFLSAATRPDPSGVRP